MAYILFGGSPADFAVDTTTVPASAGGTAEALVLAGGVSMVAWNAGASGSQITDLLLFTGSYVTPGAAAPSGVFPSLSDGTVLVWAQDSVAELWVTQSGSVGQRWLLQPVNQTARIIAIEALDPIGSAEKGAASGIVPLNASSKIDSTYLPAGTGGVESINGLTGTVALNEANTGFVPNTRKVTVAPGLTVTNSGRLDDDILISPQIGTDPGTVAAGNHTHGGFTTSPRPAFVQVLSTDMPTAWKTAAAADAYTLVCDGTNDEVQINQAIDLAAPFQSRNAGMPAGAANLGKVQLSGGRFNIGSAGIVMRTAVHLEGAGIASTEVRAVACNQPGMIRLGSVNDHLCHVSNMWLHGNGSSGGTCSAIDFDMTGGNDTSLYPPTSPDSYHHVHDLYVYAFEANANRNGIKMWAGSTANNRGNIIDRIQMRTNYTSPSGHGIWLTAASDCLISNCHIGGMGGNAFNIQTGNTKIVNCKSFYTTGAGFYFSSGRGIISNCESQDDETGYYFDASPQTASGLIADTSNVAGIRVSTSEMTLTGFTVFNRGNGRYAATQRGLWYDGTYNDTTLIGAVKASAITTPISGTVPTVNSNVQVLTI
jgi:hypothetical protein